MTKRKKGKEDTPRPRPIAAVSELMRGFRVEIDPCAEGLSVTVCGAQRVSSFSDTYVELVCGRRRVALRGEALLLTVFENRRTQVTGVVREVSLCG